MGSAIFYRRKQREPSLSVPVFFADFCDSVEIVGSGGVVGGDAGKGRKMGGVNGGLTAFGNLQTTFDEQERLGGDEELVLVEGVARDEEVGDAGFVFETDEAVAFGGGRALAADDHAGRPYRDAVV